MSCRNIFKAGVVGLALWAGAFMISGCSDSGTSSNKGGGGDLVGEWFVDLEPNYKGLLIVKPSEACIVDFTKIANFWIESEFDECVPYTINGQSVLVQIMPGLPLMQIATFSISGNTATITPDPAFCDPIYMDCAPVTATKSSLASVRNTLGTVYQQDPALHSAPGIDDLAWEMGTRELIFDAGPYFYDGGYYMEDYFWETAWYTVGSRVFLLGLDEDNAILKTVELDYSVTTGAQRTLTIRRVLPDGGLDATSDVWQAVDIGGDWFWSPPEGDQQAKKAQTRKQNRSLAFMRSR
jgi:hypothetical protein